MEKSDLNVEEQPRPSEGASPEANARFQEKVNDLGQALMRKFQMSGNQFNALELELRLFILVEQVNVLTEIIKKFTGGEHTDESLTDAMTVRVGKLTEGLLAALNAAPRVAIAGGALPPRLNGSKHN